MTTKEWLIKTKTDEPDLSQFITKLEIFISDSGLNNSKFETAVDNGLTNIELKLKETFKPDQNVEN